MDDLISRQAAIEALKKAYWDANIQSAKDDPCVIDAMTDWAIRQIKEVPSVQPEIIRCKDCRYSEYDALYDDRYCHYDGKADIVPDEHYCGYAERRTDE